jgi:peptidyl-tRNA hydrolase
MGHYEVKQVLVWRADLNTKYSVSKGKLIAQMSHASLGAILAYGHKTHEDETGAVYELKVPKAVAQWIDTSFAKVALKAENEDALIALQQKAQAAGLNAKLIVDNGTTVFGRPTITCLAIGPDYSDKIDEITKDLKLL